MRAVVLALSLLATLPVARADEGGDAADLEKQGYELFRKDDYKGAREKLDKALAADPENDEVRRTLAMIAYYFAEDAVAREHISKLKSKGDHDAKLETILDSPFKKIYGDAVVLMGASTDATLAPGLPKKGHYVVTTDYGYDKGKWTAAKGDYDALCNAAKKNKKGEKALEAWIQKNRTPGVIEAGKCLEDIHAQYSAMIKFEKDARLVSRVFVFKERGDYLDFCTYLTGEDHKDTAGLYMGDWRLLLVSREDTGKTYGFLWEGTRHVLYHEAFHQYLHYWMDAPSWINEGLAEVFGDADNDAKTGQLQVGNLKRKPTGAEGMTNFQSVTGALKPTALFPVYPIKEFVRISQATYYAKDAPTEKDHQLRMHQNYAQGWAVCYFLVMKYPGGRSIIFNYLKALKAKKSNEEAIAEAFKGQKTDADWAKIDKEFRAYMAELAAQGDDKK